MTTDWFLRKDDQQYGPFAAEQLRQMARGGMLQPTDLVWKEGMVKPQPAAKLKGLFQTGSTAPQAEVPPSPSQPSPAPTVAPKQAGAAESLNAPSNSIARPMASGADPVRSPATLPLSQRVDTTSIPYTTLQFPIAIPKNVLCLRFGIVITDEHKTPVLWAEEESASTDTILIHHDQAKSRPLLRIAKSGIGSRLWSDNAISDPQGDLLGTVQWKGGFGQAKWLIQESNGRSLFCEERMSSQYFWLKMLARYTGFQAFFPTGTLTLVSDNQDVGFVAKDGNTWKPPYYVIHDLHDFDGYIDVRLLIAAMTLNSFYAMKT